MNSEFVVSFLEQMMKHYKIEVVFMKMGMRDSLRSEMIMSNIFPGSKSVFFL